MREAKTLPYLEKDIVIGNEFLDINPFEAFKVSNGFLPARNEQMMILGAYHPYYYNEELTH